MTFYFWFSLNNVKTFIAGLQVLWTVLPSSERKSQLNTKCNSLTYPYLTHEVDVDQCLHAFLIILNRWRTVISNGRIIHENIHYPKVLHHHCPQLFYLLRDGNAARIGFCYPRTDGIDFVDNGRIVSGVHIHAGDFATQCHKFLDQFSSNSSSTACDLHPQLDISIYTWMCGGRERGWR